MRTMRPARLPPQQREAQRRKGCLRSQDGTDPRRRRARGVHRDSGRYAARAARRCRKCSRGRVLVCLGSVRRPVREAVVRRPPPRVAGRGSIDGHRAGRLHARIETRGAVRVASDDRVGVRRGARCRWHGLQRIGAARTGRCGRSGRGHAAFAARDGSRAFHGAPRRARVPRRAGRAADPGVRRRPPRPHAPAGQRRDRRRDPRAHRLRHRALQRRDRRVPDPHSRGRG